MYSLRSLTHISAIAGKDFVNDYTDEETEKWNLLDSKMPLYEELIISNQNESDYNLFLNEYKNNSLLYQEILFSNEEFGLERCFNFKNDICIDYEYLQGLKSLKSMLLWSVFQKLIDVWCSINEIRRAFQYFLNKDLYLEYVIYQSYMFEESYLLYVKKWFSWSYGFVNKNTIWKFLEISDEEAILINLWKKWDFHFDTIDVIWTWERELIRELLQSSYTKATISKKWWKLDMLIKEHSFFPDRKFSDLEKEFPFSDITSSVHKWKSKTYTVKEKIKLKK